MKLTKAQIKAMEKVNDLVNSDKPLTFEEKLFILENYQEGANTTNSALGAFFTPYELARDFCHEVNHTDRVIDLCAGIGALSLALTTHYKPEKLYCVELNAEYVKIGKRIVPDAHWIHADALKVKFKNKFDVCISNPPFGNIKTSDVKGKYTGSNFEFKLMEHALDVAEYGIFIIPQSSSNFRYSGRQCFETQMPAKVKKFLDQTGYEMSPGMGIDTSYYRDKWHGVSPLCEVVYLEKA
ncbi:MAG: hypothetical protein [Caudoviricetes sp.]|nr:MAG: hypothetical protein [Caudoviricetes sp.]